MNLYRLQGEAAAIEALLIESEGEVDELIDAHLAQLDRALEADADNWVCLLKELAARAAVRKQEAQRLEGMAQRDLKAADRVKFGLKRAMEALGHKKLTGPHGELAIQVNGGPLGLDVFGPVPDEFNRVRIEPDNELIRQQVEAENPNALAFAKFKPRGTSLRVR